MSRRYDRRKYKQALPFAERLLAVREKALGPEHLDVASVCNDLAKLYLKQEEYERAEPFYERALAIREKVLGPEHSDVGDALSKLARLYQYKGGRGDLERSQWSV